MTSLNVYSNFSYQINIMFALLICLISGCTSEAPTELAYGQINVEIWQHGRPVIPRANTYELDKSSFDIRTEFSKPLKLLVSADYRGNVYDQIQQGIMLENLDGFYISGMAEGLRNKERFMFLSDHVPSFWFYDDPEKNRCNEIIEQENHLICVRTINQVIYQGEDKSETMSEYSHDFIYMSLFTFNYEKATRSHSQISENTFILSFRY